MVGGVRCRGLATFRMRHLDYFGPRFSRWVGGE